MIQPTNSKLWVVSLNDQTLFKLYTKIRGPILDDIGQQYSLRDCFQNQFLGHNNPGAVG